MLLCYEEMKIRSLLPWSLVLLSLVFSACSHKPIVPRVTFVSAFQDNKTVLVEQGGIVHLELESQADDVYRWVIQGQVPENLKQIGNARHRAYTDALGSANMTLFEFKAVQPGLVEVTLAFKHKTTGETKRNFTLITDIRPEKDVFVR